MTLEAFFSEKRQRGLAVGPSESDVAAFWSSVHKTPTCWLWMGDTRPSGYGSARCGGTIVMAHRLAWRIHHGESPAHNLVCHTCDVPGCVRPDHLFLGTHKENLSDAADKNRMTKKLTEEEVVEMLRLIGEGLPINKIADIFGIAHYTLRSIVKGRCWIRAVKRAEEAGFFSAESQPVIAQEREIPTLGLNIAAPKSVSFIDTQIADRLVARRKLLQLSQGDLAAAVGVTYQMMHKYEAGKNRISAARLFQIAHALNVPIGFFFDDRRPVAETKAA